MTDGSFRITEIEEFNTKVGRRTEAKAFKYRKPDLKGEGRWYRWLGATLRSP